jgi:hypothetical protein
MKKTIAVSVTVLASIALAGCSGGGGSAPAPTPAPTVTVTQEVPVPAPAPTTEVPQNNDDNFLSYVRGQDAAFYAVDDYTILSVAQNVCDSISIGVSVRDLVGYAIESGLTSNQTASLFAGAVIYLCPENKALVDSQM